MFGHDARHTSRTFLVGPQRAHVVWRRATGFSSSPVGVPSVPAVAADGTIYVAVADGTVYLPTVEGLHAVSPLGFGRWFVATAQALRSMPAVGGDGTLYVNGDYQDVYAIGANGTTKWIYQIPGAFPAGPAIAPGGRLYVGTGVGTGAFSYLYAFGPN